MKKYIALAVINLGPGAVLELNADQAKARAYALEEINKDNGIYRATAALQFKRGEVIGLEAEPPKAMANELVDEREAAKLAQDEAKRKKADSAAREKLVAEAGAAAQAALLAALPAGLRRAVEKALAQKGNGG